jgi:hypothetical protein
VLTSPEPTFARALRASLGLGVDALGAEWTRWLERVGAAR